MRLPLLFLCLSSFAVFGASLTPEKALAVRNVSEPRWSPDGSRVAFTVQEPAHGRDVARHIWVYDVARGEARQWTFSAKSEHEPRWSPDGKTLAFLSDREDKSQIWLMPTNGGEAMKLTGAKNSVSTFRWSPDGKRIAYLASDPTTDAEEKKTKAFDDAKVIDKDDKHPRLWTIDIASRVVHQETKEPWAVRELEWMPDSKRLLIVATDKPALEKYTNRVFLLALDSGHMDEVLAPRGPFRGIKVAPDGASFAYTGARVDGPQPHDVYVCSLETRAPKNLTEAIDRQAHDYEWTDASSLAVLFSNGFHTELDLVGGARRKLIRDDAVNPSSFDIDHKGAVAYAAGSAAALTELWIDGKRATHLNDAAFDGIALVKPEFYRYRSFDGLEIEAALYLPAGAVDGQPGPLVVLVHGGPTGAWSDRFDGLTQLLVAHGYTIVQPNIRGSIGYGQKFIEANRADWGGADFKDVMAGVDDLVRRKIADPNRLGICGWSYGGYMAEWAITQTDRFKAAVSGAGMADLATEFGTETSALYDEWFNGTPYENSAVFQKSSPIAFIRNAKTPTLVLQGDADTTDPISQSQMLYRGLKRYNVPAEFVVYPREPHGLREQKHLIDRYTRIVAWFDKYLATSKQAAAE